MTPSQFPSKNSSILQDTAPIFNATPKTMIASIGLLLAPTLALALTETFNVANDPPKESMSPLKTPLGSGPTAQQQNSLKTSPWVLGNQCLGFHIRSRPFLQQSWNYEMVSQTWQTKLVIDKAAAGVHTNKSVNATVKRGSGDRSIAGSFAVKKASPFECTRLDSVCNRLKSQSFMPV